MRWYIRCWRKLTLHPLNLDGNPWLEAVATVRAAKLTDLVECCAEITGVPEATAREISRRLRESRLITSGKVGRYGGADMTTSDAAGLLTGLLVASTSIVSISDLGSVTKSYLNLRSHLPRPRPPLPPGSWHRALALPLLNRLQDAHSFKDALSALIHSAGNGDLERAINKWAESDSRNTFSLDVKVFRPRPHPEAWIEFESSEIGNLRLLYLRPTDVKNIGLFTPNEPRKWTKVLSNPSGFDLEISASVKQETIAAVGLLLHKEAC
jgi:hypothetical protein